MTPKKVKTGIYGLNSLLDGGFNLGSTNVVIGSAGAGKTTFAIQFIRRGLEDGRECVFVSLDENKDQIIEEAVAMGWTEILDYLKEEKLFFIDASGRDFATFIKEELPSFVNDWKGVNARIAIDPLTPVIWSIKDVYEQRDVLSMLFKLSKKIGTVICTLEEHGRSGTLSGAETIIPMYLADCVIHMCFSTKDDGTTTRNLRIIKCRNSRHSDRIHPYIILYGFGVVVQNFGYPHHTGVKLTEQFKSTLSSATLSIPPSIKQKFTVLLNNLTDDDFKQFKLDDLLRVVLEEYGAK